MYTALRSNAQSWKVITKSTMTDFTIFAKETNGSETSDRNFGSSEDRNFYSVICLKGLFTVERIGSSAAEDWKFYRYSTSAAEEGNFYSVICLGRGVQEALHTCDS